MLVQEGATFNLTTIYRSGGSPFFVGLCGNAAADNFLATLADITDEPSTANGYARLQLNADIVDWPTLELVNNMMRMASKQLTWTPAGGDFDKAITRTFLCDVVSGTVGQLFSFSGPLAAPLTITPTTPFDAIVEQWEGQ